MKNHTRQKFRHATSLLVNCSLVLHVKAPILHAAIFRETNTMSIWWMNMVGHEMVAAHVGHAWLVQCILLEGARLENFAAPRSVIYA